MVVGELFTEFSTLFLKPYRLLRRRRTKKLENPKRKPSTAAEFSASASTQVDMRATGTVVSHEKFYPLLVTKIHKRPSTPAELLHRRL